MNTIEHELSEVAVEELAFPEAIECLLNTILSQRALGPTDGRMGESTLFDCRYPVVDDPQVAKTIATATSQLQANLKPVGLNLKRGRLMISFFEKRKRAGLFGITMSTEKVCWERWLVTFVVDSRRREAGSSERAVIDRRRRQADMNRSIQNSILEVASVAVKSTAHLPPVNFGASRSPMMFRYEIKALGTDGGEERWFSKLASLTTGVLGSGAAGAAAGGGGATGVVP